MDIFLKYPKIDLCCVYAIYLYNILFYAFDTRFIAPFVNDELK